MFAEKLLEGWERAETNTGCLYYINHKREKTQWNHPIYVKIMEELADMDGIKYAAYRTSMKLRFLQKRFRLDLVDIHVIRSVFERHGYVGPMVDTVIDSTALYSLLVDVFTMSRKGSVSSVMSQLNADTAAELLLNLLLNLYDVNRTGCVRVPAVKVTLVLLCAARLMEKYRYLFAQLSDASNHLSRKVMGVFLHDVMQLPELLNEGAVFGGLNVAPAVDSCFSAVWNSAGITETNFISWMLLEPQTVVWLPTMHRLAAAETVKHEAKCSVCKMLPIVGFRYRCLKCFNYDLCQHCFFTGRVSKKHKSHHPTQEYCLAASVKEDTKAFMRTIRNNLNKKHRHRKKAHYLPIYGTDQPYKPDEFIEQPLGTQTMLTDSSAKQTDTSSSPRISKCLQTDITGKNIQDAGGVRDGVEMEAMIYQLEDENRELLDELERTQSRSYTSHRSSPTGSDGSKNWLEEENERLAARQEVLEAHNRQLEEQLHRLQRLVKERDILMSPVTAPSVTPSPCYRLPPDSSSALVTPYPLPPAYGRLVAPPTRSTPIMAGSVPHRLTQTPGGISEISNISPLGSRLGHAPVTRVSPGGGSQNYALDDETTQGLTDPTLGRTRFTLPSPHSSHRFQEEEAELQEMIDRLDAAYPDDMSHSTYETNGTMDEMYRAARHIGEAFSHFVAPSLARAGKCCLSGHSFKQLSLD
ncbi:hypothetical protein NP493_2g13047 [Ridgeia piscesae]|uniref:Dystrophin n=1 Tax=Ridgeia piscesae TaxID=27915 RepID=A0AAD9PG22_RIDPI|nr:hypothetical protein NP493_2g13047 [Ridgeia piscesae]